MLGLLALWPSKTGVVVISSLIFGLIHWGLGPAVVVTAALWGILPAISVLLVRSIYPAIIAHYVTNFVDFSGLF